MFTNIEPDELGVSRIGYSRNRSTFRITTPIVEQ